MPVNISSKGMSVYFQSRTETTSEVLKRLAHRIRVASRRHLIHSEYSRLRDPIISKAYSTMTTHRNLDDSSQQCSNGLNRQFLT